MGVFLAIVTSCGPPDPPSTFADSSPADTSSSSDSSDTGANPCLPAAVELGTGEDQHMPLSAHDPVTMVHGPQGGWHIDVSARITALGPVVGFAPSVVETATEVQLAGNQRVAYESLVPLDRCSGVVSGVRAFLDDPGDVDQKRICALEGAELRLGLVVTDLATSKQASASVLVVAQLDPADAAYGCP